jgi:hypothetical protein
MKRRHYFGLLIVSSLAACGGGGSSIMPASETTGNNSSPTTQSVALLSPLTRQLPIRTLAFSLQSDAPQSVLRESASGATDLLYVGNDGNNSITVYPHTASGNVAPVRVISGPRTGISDPGQLAEDGQNNLYVANGKFGTTSINPAILVFAHGANGNVAPIRKIAGSRTGLNVIEAVTVDKTTGDIFVMDSEPLPNNAPQFFSSILRFAPNANGNVAPVSRSNIFNSYIYDAYQIASDSTGKNLIEAHFPASPNSTYMGVATYPKYFPNDATINYIYRVDAMNPGGVADDPTTRTYVTSTPGGIYRLAESTVGNGPFGGGGPLPIHFTPALVSIITSDTCGGQLATAPGPSPYTYVMDECAGDPYPTVRVYTNGASGNALPLRVLGGPATLMNLPYGITEGP